MTAEDERRSRCAAEPAEEIGQGLVRALQLVDHPQQIRQAERGARRDVRRPGRAVEVAFDPTTLDRVGRRLEAGDPEWRRDWLAAAEDLRVRKETVLSRLPWGECKGAWMVANAAGFDLFQPANSMSIRHANLFCGASSARQRILANRGASGIDGTISTFLGSLAATDGRGLALIGDLAAHGLLRTHVDGNVRAARDLEQTQHVARSVRHVGEAVDHVMASIVTLRWVSRTAIASRSSTPASVSMMRDVIPDGVP